MNAHDEFWMTMALELAKVAAGVGEIPVGAIIVRPAPEGTGVESASGLPDLGRIIGRGYNRREVDADPSAHAEMVALREAGQANKHWRLLDCTMYVTLEPCPMCAGALVNARLSRLVYGCTDPKAGAVETLYQICNDPRLNHRLQVTAGVLGEQCSQVLKDFFAQRRAAGKNRGGNEAKN